MTIQANSSGVVSGKFHIPANIPAGVKEVRFEGAGGSFGVAAYDGRGTLIQETWQPVRTLVYQRYDPLAETFTLPDMKQIVAVELWFQEKGAHPVRVQFRETTAGVPNNVVLGEGTILPTNINTGGQATAVIMDEPVTLRANTEYAVVVLTDDPNASVAIAALGAWDSNSQKWVTSQPYEIGVLLSSANASSWTPHQDRDLAFRLITLDYSADGMSRTVNLGFVQVTGATDLIVRSVAQAPSADSTVTYELTLPDGTVLPVVNEQPVHLTAAITGNVTVKAVLKAKDNVSAILYPGTMLVVGVLQGQATYVTRLIPAGNNAKVRIVYDGYVPSGATVAVEVQADTGGSWTTVANTGTVQLGDGWVEYTAVLNSYTATSLRVRLTLNGTPAARPRIKNLRVMTV